MTFKVGLTGQNFLLRMTRRVAKFCTAMKLSGRQHFAEPTTPQDPRRLVAPA